MRPSIPVGVLVALLGVSLAGLAIANDQRAPWTPKCLVLGCAESVNAMDLPDGAVLTFKTCHGKTWSEYAYKRAGKSWELTLYATKQVAACAPAAR